jgi:hypothetical protein
MSRHTSLAATSGGGETDATLTRGRKDALMNMLDHWRRAALATTLIAITIIAACSTQTASPSAPSAPTSPSAEPSANPTPSEPQGSPAPTPPTATPPSVDWAMATVPESANASAMTSVVPGGDGLVAIGSDGAFGSILWTSEDGTTWRDITPEGFASVGIANVIEFDGGLIAVGRGNTIDVDAQQAAVYRSDDGVTWHMVDAGEEMLGQLIDVVATDDGLYAVGGVPGADAAGIWRSTDGDTWERTGGDFEHAFMWSIAEGGPGLVAVGWRRNPDPDLAVWTSVDGAEWTLAPDPEGFEGYEGTDVIEFDGTLAMVGSSLATGQGGAWFSDDGIAWERAEMSGGTGSGYARTITRTPAGLVATGTAGEMHAGAWLSTDGRTWQPFGDPLPNAFFHTAYATDDGLLALGATQEGTLETGIQAHAMLWSAILDD